MSRTFSCITVRRERKGDIPLLLTRFLQRFAQGSGKHPLTFAPEAMERLVEYHWPGNIREMENLVKYLLTVTRGDTIRLVPAGHRFRRRNIRELSSL